ncbi:MAG: outer-membrane lipoprotein carrier protein LolA [Gemmatimonadales bacterium]
MSRIALPTVLTLALLPGAAAAQDPVAIVGRAGRVYRGLSSLRAEFTQIIEDRSQGDTLTSRGIVYQSGNNLFAMRFSDPDGEAVVVDGKYIWTYTPSTAPDVVYRRNLPTDPVYGVNLLAQLLDRPQDRYQTTYLARDTVRGRPVDVVELVPLTQSINFARARLWLGTDDALPRRIILDEGPGSRRTIDLTSLRPNATIPRGTFKFEVPSGVRIIADPGF